MDISTAFVLLALLQVKHMFADFYMQTPRMLSDRGVYIHSGRVMHCLVHSAGSAVALFLVAAPLGMILLLLVVEWLLHYHIDFAKGAWSNRKDHGPEEASYWRAFGMDQMLHGLTYLGMVWVLLP